MAEHLAVQPSSIARFRLPRHLPGYARSMESRASSIDHDRTTISVQGSAVLRRTPELATVRLSVEVDGEDRAAVLERALTTRSEASSDLGEQRSPSPGVVTWSSPQVRVWDARPWNQQGEQLPLVHHAAASINAVFDDPGRLAQWLATVAGVDGVAVQQVEWSLTEASLIAVETEALGAAVADARRRADVIASALGFLTLRPLAVGDPGLLSSTDDPRSMMASDSMQPRLLKAAAAPGTGEGFALEPEELLIEVVVHARFTAE